MQSDRLITDFPSPVYFRKIINFEKISDHHAVYIIDKKLENLYDFKNISGKTIFIKADENEKSLDTIYQIIEKLTEMDTDRTTILIGIGGGIITDITGFTASIFKRGIKFILIPTTLLSMVDAAYGGKTGVNFKGIKNHIGTFAVPEKIIVDTNFLSTLPKVEKLNGLCEILKIAFTSDSKLFKILEETDTFDNLDIEFIIEQAILTKKKIIEQDLYDSGIRNILNFGHTYGHAIESYYKIKHGFAVILGALLELKTIAFLTGNSNDVLYGRFYDIANKFNLIEDIDVDIKMLNYLLKQDKKISSQFINLVDVREVGYSEIKKFEIFFLSK